MLTIEQEVSHQKKIKTKNEKKFKNDQNGRRKKKIKNDQNGKRKE